MKSSDICAALRERYKQPEWSLFFEVANGTGSNVRRHADALAMNMYPSRGMAILGFEIKVSRSDLKRELINPDKAEEIGRYCNEWWLVVPKGLVKEDDMIPVTWGIMECDNGALRVSKKAKWMDAKPVTKDFMAAVLRSAGKVDEDTIKVARAQAASDAWKNHEESVKNAVERETERFHKLRERVEAFEKATGQSLNRYTDIEGLAERIKLATDIDKLYGRWGTLQGVRRQMESFLKETAVMTDIEQ